MGFLDKMDLREDKRVIAIYCREKPRFRNIKTNTGPWRIWPGNPVGIFPIERHIHAEGAIQRWRYFCKDCEFMYIVYQDRNHVQAERYV